MIRREEHVPHREHVIREPCRHRGSLSAEGAKLLDEAVRKNVMAMESRCISTRLLKAFVSQLYRRFVMRMERFARSKYEVQISIRQGRPMTARFFVETNAPGE